MLNHLLLELFIPLTGEALDIYDILKLTDNGILEESKETKKGKNPQKESILQSSN